MVISKRLSLSPSSLGTLLVLISAVGYGTEAIFIKLAYQSQMSPMQVIWLRFALATLVLSPVVIRHGRSIPRSAHVVMAVIGAGLNAAVVFCLAQSLATTSASITIVCLYLYPALVSLIAGPILGEPLTGTRVLALTISLLGVGLVSWTPGSWVISTGIVYALAAACLNALAIVLMKKHLSSLPGLVVSAETLAWGAVTFSIVALAAKTRMVVPVVGVGYTIGLAIFSTVIPFATLYTALTMIEASRAVLITTVEPVITALLAAIFLAERMTGLQAFGGALVLASLVLGSRSPSASRRRES
ncbi:MAG: DMT family transporter [Bacillota bacterium]